MALMRTPQPVEQPAAPTDWSRISLGRETAPPARPSEPTRAVSVIDARILADDEIDELRRLRDACVEWFGLTPNPLRGTDKKLAHAIRRARRFAR